MFQNPGCDWHPGKGVTTDPIYISLVYWMVPLKKMPLSFGQGVILATLAQSHPHVLATPACACTADPLTLSFLPPENMTKTLAMFCFCVCAFFFPTCWFKILPWDQWNTTGPNKRFSQVLGSRSSTKNVFLTNAPTFQPIKAGKTLKWRGVSNFFWQSLQGKPPRFVKSWICLFGGCKNQQKYNKWWFNGDLP